MRARSVPVVLLVVGLLGLGTADPARADADTTPPVLHSVSLATPGPFTTGDVVTVQWDVTDDAGVKDVQVELRDSAGKQHWVHGVDGAASGGTTVDVGWSNGTVSVASVYALDVNQNWVVYRSNGSTETSSGASGTHVVDLHAADFTVRDVDTDLTPPSLSSLAMTTPSTRTAGDSVTLAWDASDANGIAGFIAVYRDPSCGLHDVLAATTAGTGRTATTTVDSSWREGPTELVWLELSDPYGNSVRYSADGTTTVYAGGSRPGPAHGFDFAALSVTTHDTGGDGTPPVLTALARQGSNPYWEGQPLGYDGSATDASGVASMLVTLKDAAGKSHFVYAAPWSPPSAPIDSSWAIGNAAVQSVDIADANGNHAVYRRDGSLERSPSCGAPAGTHSWDLSALDVQVVATPTPSATATPTPVTDTTAPTVVADEFADPGTLAPSVSLSWSGSDAGTGVASYDVAYRTATATRGFQGWIQPPAWQGLTTTGLSAGISPGTTLCFLVRGRDNAGNLSPWSPSRCVTRAYDDAVLKPSVGWYRTYLSTLYGGSALRTTLHGATATTGTVTVRHLALVATTCASCGKVVVEIGGQSVATVNLVSSTTRRRQLLPIPLSALRTGAVRLRVVSSGRVVEIDGLLLSRV